MRRRLNVRRFVRDNFAQLLLILGFTGAALTQEVINITHEFMKKQGEEAYVIYNIVIIGIWLALLYGIMKLITNAYAELKLSDTNPEGDTLPRGAQGVTMMSFDLNASNEGSVTVKHLTVSYVGDEQKGIEGIYLTINGGRMSPVERLNKDGEATLHFQKPFPLGAGQNVTVDVNADFARTTGKGSQHRLMLESEKCFVVNAGSTGGKYPLWGNHFIVADATCGLLSINYRVPKGDTVVGAISIAADSVEDQTLYSITFKKGGNLGDDNLRNIHLTDAQGNKLTNVAKQMFGDYVTLVFDPPLAVIAGTRIDLDICAEAKSPEVLEMYLEDASDLFAVGHLYGYGTKGQLFGSSIRIEGTPESTSIE